MNKESTPSRLDLTLKFTASFDTSALESLNEKLMALEEQSLVTQSFYAATRAYLAELFECREITDTRKYPDLVYFEGETEITKPPIK